MTTIFQLYRDSPSYWLRKSECPEKPIGILQATDKLLSHNVVHLDIVGFKLATLVVVGIDCIGNCKSNYHMITTLLSYPRL